MPVAYSYILHQIVYKHYAYFDVRKHTYIIHSSCYIVVEREKGRLLCISVEIQFLEICLLILRLIRWRIDDDAH